MFDYARNMQLALSDAGRRAGMKAAAGVVALIGAGFLLAALWTFLAYHLHWGSLGASLAIGLLFVIIGVVLISMSKTVKHPVPSTDELRAEVEARVSLATDAALEKARLKATEVVDNVEGRVATLVDDVSYRAAKFADDAEAKVQGFARDAEAKVQGFTRNVAGEAANRVGLTPQFLADTRDTLSRVKESNAATIPPLMGAFAVGVALASKLQNWRHRDDDDYDFVEGDYDDDERYDADGFYR